MAKGHLEENICVFLPLGMPRASLKVGRSPSLPAWKRLFS
jgi:hypothetical protein